MNESTGWEPPICRSCGSREGIRKIRELLKLLNRPDIISFAGGIRTRRFSRWKRRGGMQCLRRSPTICLGRELERAQKGAFSFG